MERLEQIEALNQILLAEMPEYRSQGERFPREEGAQRRLPRSLMNLRPPMPLDPDFLTAQDALLSAETAEKGVVDGDALVPTQADSRLVLWQGGHHPAAGGRHRQRGQLRPAGVLPPLPRVHRQCHSSLNHTGVYLVKQDRMLLHLEFPWVSIASDASPREQLRYYREYRGLLRRELGDMTGMSETTILNYELGYMPIAYDKAKRLAKALEIDEKLLLDDYCRFLDYPFQLRCKELRSELGLTQFEIADKAGIARGTYGTWECAAVRPGREPFQKFAAFITSQGKEVV